MSSKSQGSSRHHAPQRLPLATARPCQGLVQSYATMQNPAPPSAAFLPQWSGGRFSLKLAPSAPFAFQPCCMARSSHSSYGLINSFPVVQLAQNHRSKWSLTNPRPNTACKAHAHRIKAADSPLKARKPRHHSHRLKPIQTTLNPRLQPLSQPQINLPHLH